MQQNLSSNLALVLAHSVVFFTKEYYSPNGIVDDARNGDAQAPSASESTQQQLNALTTMLPSLIYTAGTNIPWYEQQLQYAQNFITPQQNQLQLDQLKQFGPEYNKITSDIAGQNQLANISNDAAALRASGGSGGLVETQMGLDRTLNPEFYSTRAAAAKSLSDLLGSININGLSGSERAEIERAVNRNNVAGGNDGVGSALNTARNASMFGSALQAKRDSLGAAIDRATSFLPASRTNIDPFKLATGKDSGPANVGGTQFGGSSPGVGSSTMGLTNSLLAQTGENQRTGMNINANARDALDRTNETMSSVGSLIGGSGCCFIFLESYNGILPDHVRICRDYFYKKEPQVALGYKLMAKYLVPLMQKSGAVKSLMNIFMVKPITRYGNWLINASYSDRKYIIVKNFWFGVWRILGSLSKKEGVK